MSCAGTPTNRRADNVNVPVEAGGPFWIGVDNIITVALRGYDLAEPLPEALHVGRGSFTVWRDDGVLLMISPVDVPGGDRIAVVASDLQHGGYADAWDKGPIELGEPDPPMTLMDGTAGVVRLDLDFDGRCHLLQEIPVVVQVNHYRVDSGPYPFYYTDLPAPPTDPPEPPVEHHGGDTGDGSEAPDRPASTAVGSTDASGREVVTTGGGRVRRPTLRRRPAVARRRRRRDAS